MIADAAGISRHMLNRRFKKIYEKLHVHSATEAVKKQLIKSLFKTDALLNSPRILSKSPSTFAAGLLKILT